TAQQCDSGRFPSLADFVANTAGALIGSLIAIDLRWNFAALLSACWIGSRTIPFLPSVNFHKYWAAIHFAFTTPSLLDVLHYFALWLAAAILLERRFLLAIGFILVARIVIIDVALSSAEITGALLAATLWRLLPPSNTRIRCATSALLIFVMLSAMEPF